MSSESPSELKFDIGHVLFIDIVGYSKLLIAEQSDQIQTLREIVRGTEQFKEAEAEGKLLRLPTGDGGALVFRNSLEAPVLCALEISKALKSHPELKVRMGIHSGPVNEITDLNEQANIAGVGINLAQRVMDCGDAGHILLSKRVADDLEQYPQWRSHLSDLGECEVKHGTRVSVVNLYTEDAGNPVAPQKFSKRSATASLSASVPRRDSKFALIIGAALVLVIVGGALWFLSRQKGGHSSTSTSSSSSAVAAIPEKSIAVLPFDNLSRDPDNAYFAEGIQDEILTRLSKIADLRVISRTSTQHFKSVPENFPEIAKQLGVTNVLEGSVQKAGDRVRVNVQLINATSDAHLWAESYDRKLTDIFAVESEIATTVADTLQAKLTGSEKRAITARPTDNPVAYQDYLKGRYFWNKRTSDDFQTAISYFNQAVETDPNYALAYAGLADTYVLLPAFTWASPQDAMPKAKAAAQKALELNDMLAEAHASLAMVLRAYDFDYNQAVSEFKRAIELNPNYAPARYWLGTHVLSALGRFDDAVAEVKRALELDPLSLVANVDLGTTHVYARRFDDAIAQLRKSLELDDSFYYAHYEFGIALRCKGQIDAAIAEFEKARQLNDDPIVPGLLGHAYAARGRRDEALKLLVQLKGESARRYVPPYSVALIYVGLGDKEEALRWLEKDFSDRDGWNIGFINVDPLLDPLRDDPRFRALAQKVLGPKS